jgi:hypothetical protein
VAVGKGSPVSLRSARLLLPVHPLPRTSQAGSPRLAIFAGWLRQRVRVWLQPRGRLLPPKSVKA